MNERMELKRIVARIKAEMRTASNAEKRELRSSLTYFKGELAKLSPEVGAA